MGFNSGFKGLMQLASTVCFVEVPCCRRYFETESSNQEVIKREEQMTELWETGDCDNDDDIEKNI